MNSLVVAIQFDSDAKLSEDPELDAETNKKLQMATRIIHALLSRGQAKILATIKGMIYADISVENIEILKDMVEALKERLNINVHIGVAEDSRMAGMAAKFANAHQKHIHVFDYDAEEFAKSEPLDKAGLKNPRLQKPKLQKIPIKDLELDQAGKDRATRTFEETPDFKPSKEPIGVGQHIETGKLHLLNGYHRVHNALKNGETHIEAHVKPSQGKYADSAWGKIYQHKSAPWSSVKKSESLNKSQRDDIYDAIKVIHFNKDLFLALQEHNPEMYKSIVAIVNALSDIYAQDKEQNEQVKQSENENINLIKDEDHNGPTDPVKFNDIVDDVDDDNNKGNASDKSGDGGNGDYEHVSVHDNQEHKENEQALPKPQLSDESKKQLVDILQNLEDNQDTLAEIKQANPEVADAIDQLAGSLYEIFTHAAGNSPEEEDHKNQVNDSLNQVQGKGQKSKPATGHKIKYQPGAIRVGQDNKARQKDINGQWHTLGGTSKPLG
jgi:hypothetical protein